MTTPDDMCTKFLKKFDFLPSDIMEDKVLIDMRENVVMVFRFEGREVLGSLFANEIRFYERVKGE